MSVITDMLARFAKGQQSITEIIPLYMHAACSILFRIRIKTVVGTVGIPTSHHDTMT